MSEKVTWFQLFVYLALAAIALASAVSFQRLENRVIELEQKIVILESYDYGLEALEVDTRRQVDRISRAVIYINETDKSQNEALENILKLYKTLDYDVSSLEILLLEATKEK